MDRDTARYKGYRTIRSTHVCPKCREPCDYMCSPVRASVVGVHCTACPWEQYTPVKPWPASTKAIYRELLEIKKEL